MKYSQLIIGNVTLYFLRIEKDKSQIMIEIQDVRAATDEVARSKVSEKLILQNLIISLVLRLLQKNPTKIWWQH